MNKNLLLKLLDETEIKEKILNIVSSQGNIYNDYDDNLIDDDKIKFLEDELCDLKDENHILSEQIKESLLSEMEKDKEIEELKGKNIKLNKKLQETLKLIDIEKQNNILIYKNLTEKDEKLDHMVKNYLQMEKNYLVLQNTYLIYESLSDHVKNELSDILKGNNVETFVFCGAQYDNIEMLWDFIKDKIIQGETKEIESLEKIFDYFFRKYNTIYDEPLYEFIENEEEYDSKLHTKIQDSKTDTKIKVVFFRGYRNTNTSKVIKKTLVKI